MDPADLPRGPKGRCLCRNCGTEVPPGRRTFCGDACVEQWKLKSDPTYVRKLVGKRDRGRCAVCGMKCRDLEKALKLMGQLLGRLGHAKAFRELRKLLKVEFRKTLWDADHILAVVDGGGGCGLDNMQTLCLWCHREKTAAKKRRPGAEAPGLPA